MVQSKTLAQRCDLLPTMSKYLDPQLVFALSEFTRTRDIYDDRQLLEAQVKLLWNTNMVEFTMDLCKELHGTDTAPAELEERKDVVIQRIGQLHQNAQKIIDVISNQSTIQGLQSDRQSNSTYLKEQFGIGPEQVDTLYQYAKCIYECGQYKAAGELLHQYCTFTLDHLKLLSAMWGKLASEILDCNYIAATDTLSKLKDAIDRHLYTDALKQLQQRTWLLHWSLFIYWNVDDGCTQLLELFTQEVFTVAMQVNSPHLLRYVVAALLVSKPETAEDPRDKWRMRCNAVKRIINSEEYQYSDPLTDFAKAVFIDFDFDRAQEQLQACKEVIANDYFLAEVNDKFTNKARMAIFEVYCRIHQRINLDALATQVGMTRTEAEVWIAQLIRTARLDARIDGSAGIIVMGQQSVDPLDRIIERTNNLSMRTFKIANTIVDAMKPTAAATT